jgi:FkbH-like protein
MNELSLALKSAQDALSRGDLTSAFRGLSGYVKSTSLTLTSIAAVDRMLSVLAHHKDAAAQLPIKKIAFLCGKLSPTLLIRAVRCALVAENVLAVTLEGNYDCYQLEILDPNSEIYRFKPDLAVILTGYRDASPPADLSLSKPQATELAEAEIARMKRLWKTLNSRLRVPIVQHLFDHPPTRIAGLAERTLPGSPFSYLNTLNRLLVEGAPNYVFPLDTDFLAQQIGLLAWHSDRDYNISKTPFAPAALPAYGRMFRGAFRQISASVKKALVLDLDNTLWGGVIGDSGVDGVKFGRGSPDGEAYLAFCAYIKELRNRGVILAVCSKNDPELPRRMFAENEEMPLDLVDFSAFHCSWDDKASNIRAIAKELNIGLDSLVFVDDNPAECELVASQLPQVTVVALSGTPSNYICELDGLHLFDQQAITETDLLRAQSYQALQAAREMEPSDTNLDSFLEGLEMRSDMHFAEPAELERLAQMEARTNQFNMNTRRYRKDQIEAIAEDPNGIVMSVSLQDKFAKHGIVSSVIATHESNALRIDNWLMSCRVFSRSLEQFIMQRVIEEAKRRGAGRIVAEYTPTERNGVVADLYSRLGFSQEDEDGRWWSRDVSDGEGDSLKTFISAFGHSASESSEKVG